MTQKLLIFIIFGLFFSSCQERERSSPVTENTEKYEWNIERLNNKSIQHLDSTKWDKELFYQDI